MNRRSATLLAMAMAGLFGISSLAPAVSAQPKTPKERREDRREKRKERREKRQERREDRKEARQDRRENRQDRRKARRMRRRAARKAFLAKWGHIHKRPAVRAELRLHAWRMARLDRLRALAVEEGKDDVVKRIDELKAKEQARHEARMNKLKSAAPAGSAAPAETAAPAGGE